MSNNYTIPSRQILAKIEYQNEVMDNQGWSVLSQDYGFLPRVPPLRQLPQSHAIWDQAGQQLSQHYHQNTIREFFNDMPLLSADKYALPSRYLQRSATLIGIFAHAYYWLNPIATKTLPDNLLKPWQTICARLDRYTYFLSYSDLILHNWQLRDLQQPQNRLSDNLGLLVDTINHPAEQIFYLKQVEMAYQITPIIGAIVRAQEATVANNSDALKKELVIIIQALQAAMQSFKQISSNAHCLTYVDPIVWSRGVAPLGVSWRTNVKGPSGTSAPWFHLMDSFITRSGYESLYGQDQLYYRRMQLAPQINQFIIAVSKISVRDYIEKQRDKTLKGLFNTLVDTYAGRQGLLNQHRYKVYGYLNTAFKIGRMITTGGSESTSPLTNREWVMVNQQLEQSRKERYNLISIYDKNVKILQYRDFKEVSEISFDIKESGKTYIPGNYVALFVENQPAKITATIQALGANGDEPIELNSFWSEYIQKYLDLSVPPLSLPLRDFLKLTKLRPMQREQLKKIYKLTQSPILKEILEKQEEDQYEFIDILNIVAPHYYLEQFISAHSWENENLSNLLIPEHLRYYSIVNAPDDPDFPTQVTLCIKKLHYESLLPDGSKIGRSGVMTDYLNALSSQQQSVNPISLQFINGYDFSLPPSADSSVIMIAAGTGIAPFNAFIEQRCRQGAVNNFLLYVAADEEHAYYANNFMDYAQAGKLHFHVALTRMSGEDLEKSKLAYYHYPVAPGVRASLKGILHDPNILSWLMPALYSDGDTSIKAHFYVCGHSGFGKAVLEILLNLLSNALQQKGHENSQALAFNHIANLIANHKYCTEVFTPLRANKTVPGAEYQYFYFSQVAQHNQTNDYWIIINDEVYDITQFMQLHPGGSAILRNYSGMDATQAFNDVDHQHNASISAQLAMYKIGGLKRPHFALQSSLTLHDKHWQHLSLDNFYQHWQNYLMLFVEAENSLRLEMDHFYTKPSLAALALLSHNLLSRTLPQLMGQQLNQLWLDTIVACRVGFSIEVLPKKIARLLKKSQSLTNPFTQSILAKPTQRMATFSATLFSDIDNLLKALKVEVTQGMCLFEQNPQAVFRGGNPFLAKQLLAIATPIKHFLTQVSKSLSD